ncbi:MAG TPA: hypothetical protein DC053_00555 [Lachnoclostridium sp.]|nr:hypothetical protein [Lachnoclostridium sp.]
MIDFKELSVDGDDFELLVRELLYNKGLEVYWSGKGADGGKDLLCIETQMSCFKETSRRWLIQCKHNAKSGRAVNKSDLDSVVDSCIEHDATGYLLVCSTFPSSSLVKRLEEIQNTRNIITHFWDCRFLEKELLKPINWNISNMFFPKSMIASGWRISTLEPSFWHANFKGNVFYMAARIGTNYNFFLNDIEERLNDLSSMKLPDGHLLRLRAAYFDDKYTNYKLYLDYLYPMEKDETEYNIDDTVEEIEKFDIIEGVSYEYDIMTYRYNPYSDSYDKDSNDFYNGFVNVFKHGISRNGMRKYVYATKNSSRYITEEFVYSDFSSLVETMKKLTCIRILKSTNAKIEFIDQFTENFSWIRLVDDANYDIDNFFDVQIRFICYDIDILVKYLEVLPQSVDKHFELVRNYIFLPDIGLDNDEDIVYTLHISVHSALISSKYQFRKYMNQYLREIRDSLNSALKSKN